MLVLNAIMKSKDAINAEVCQSIINVNVDLLDLKMAGMSAVQFKLMPTSPDIDLQQIKQKAEEKIKSLGGVPGEIQEQPIAFGLKALIFSFAFPEEKDIEELESLLEKIQEVSSLEMIDYRRAIG